MFRDPSFFKAVRETVAPELKKRPFVKVWHAGCSTGEEVYSMAILLREEGMLDSATIYATDVNEAVLGRAKKGIFPIERMKDYTRNYKLAGGLAHNGQESEKKYCFFRPQSGNGWCFRGDGSYLMQECSHLLQPGFAGSRIWTFCFKP